MHAKPLQCSVERWSPSDTERRRTDGQRPCHLEQWHQNGKRWQRMLEHRQRGLEQRLRSDQQRHCALGRRPSSDGRRHRHLEGKHCTGKRRHRSDEGRQWAGKRRYRTDGAGIRNGWALHRRGKDGTRRGKDVPDNCPHPRTLDGQVRTVSGQGVPRSQVMLVFSDDTVFEFYCSDSRIGGTWMLGRGGVLKARSYIPRNAVVEEHPAPGGT